MGVPDTHKKSKKTTDVVEDITCSFCKKVVEGAQLHLLHLLIGEQVADQFEEALSELSSDTVEKPEVEGTPSTMEELLYGGL